MTLSPPYQVRVEHVGGEASEAAYWFFVDALGAFDTWASELPRIVKAELVVRGQVEKVAMQ